MNNNMKGVSMIGLMRLLVITVLFTSPMSLAISATGDSIGRMPEIVVTAPRYYTDSKDEIGVMPEVVVTAKRYPVLDENIQSQRRGYEENRFLRRVSKYLFWISVVSSIIAVGLLIFMKLLRRSDKHRQEETVSRCCA
jgi:hypothetical protein